MPLIDVSELTVDPDFADSIICRRKTQTVGADGVAANAETDIDFIGVVTASSGNNLVRTPGGEYTTGDLLVITRFALTAGGSGQDADVISWNGSDYTVTQVNSYQRFGQGYVWAVCNVLKLGG